MEKDKNPYMISIVGEQQVDGCLLYTSDAADEL